MKAFLITMAIINAISLLSNLLKASKGEVEQVTWYPWERWLSAFISSTLLWWTLELLGVVDAVVRTITS